MFEGFGFLTNRFWHEMTGNWMVIKEKLPLNYLNAWQSLISHFILTFTPRVYLNWWCLKLWSLVTVLDVKLLFLATYTPCYNGGSFHVNIVNQEYKDKIINTNGTWGFNVVRPTMPMSTNERELFHYTIKNIQRT